METNDGNIVLQTISRKITSDQTHELKEAINKDYNYVVGLSVSDVYCPSTGVLEAVKVKGLDILPENFEVFSIQSSKNVAPNRRFFSLFNPIEVNGEDIIIRFRDSGFMTEYNLQIVVLLCKDLNELKDVLYR